MNQYDYVIVGAGMAADQAIAGIRRRDRQGSILVIGAEVFPPYQRPPLSKKLWMDMRLEEVFLGGWERSGGVHLALGSPAARIDRAAQQVETEDGRVVKYRQLLLAPGAHARKIFGEHPGVYYVGTLGEHVKLMKTLSESRAVAVVGGGFIGAEMAAALSSQDHKVTWVMLESHPFAGFFPDDLASHVTEAYRRHNVEIVTDAEVTQVDNASGGGLRLTTKSGLTVEAEVVVVGVGVQPNVELAQTAGLDVSGGIVVDDYLRTSDEHIWAAGDAAVMRPANKAMLHEDHAITQGKLAGENMAGANKKYTHEPFFYSDLYEFGYEAIGDCRTVHDVVEDWVTPGEEGIIYYLDQHRVVGVLNWNVWDGIPQAESLIQSGEPVGPDTLRGRIRNAVD